MATTWMVAELTAPRLLMASFTAKYPGCTIDVISEPAVEEGADRVHPSLVMVKFAPVPALAGLLGAIAVAYGPPQTIRRYDEDEVWVGRVRIPERALQDPGARALTTFQDRFDVPWMHMSGGVLHMRARIQPGVDPHALLEQCDTYLRDHSIEAQVTLQEVSPHDFGVWRELVEYAVGLAP